jgi:hypothetical protein
LFGKQIVKHFVKHLLTYHHISKMFVKTQVFFFFGLILNDIKNPTSSSDKPDIKNSTSSSDKPDIKNPTSSSDKPDNVIFLGLLFSIDSVC